MRKMPQRRAPGGELPDTATRTKHSEKTTSLLAPTVHNRLALTSRTFLRFNNGNKTADIPIKFLDCSRNFTFL